MSWQIISAMGTNMGNGGGGGSDLAGGSQGNGANHPPATEYTLQGVMRFLQTEWHRHERDRNAWEIEKQEMKGRIATLEGQARRADATQKALRKYVIILEQKVKDQAAKLKSGDASSETKAQADKADRAALIQEKLRIAAERSAPVSGEVQDLDKGDDESQRSELKAFLDQCQAEFVYLMITPANPLPPRESPPLPLLEEGEGFGLPGSQQAIEQAYQQPPRPNHVREINPRAPPAPNHAPPPQPSHLQNLQNKKNAEIQSAPMVRSGPEHHQPPMFASAQEWTRPISVPSARVAEATETLAQLNHAAENYESAAATDDSGDKRMGDADGWDFSEGNFTPVGAGSLPQAASGRPDTDVFPSADNLPKSPSRGPPSHRRKGSMSRRRSAEHELSLNAAVQKAESGNFKLAFGLRGHLDTVRTVIFSGGGSPGEPEICTAGDDGMIKRFHIPRFDPHSSLSNAASDLDVMANFTHRGHQGPVLCLTSWSPSPNFSTGGRAQGDGWIFSGGQDATIRVWERGRVDPKATIEGHTDAVWAVCVLPGTLGAVFGQSAQQYGNADRILLASGAADGTVKIWAVSAPPQLTSPQPGTGRRGGPGVGGAGARVRGNSMSSGSAFPNSPQPTTASSSPFHHTLVYSIARADGSRASPTCITPLGASGETFVVSYADAAIVVYDTRTGEEAGAMASLETYDGTMDSSVNAVVATTVGLEQAHQGAGLAEEDAGTGPVGGPTGGGRSMAGSGVEGVIISGHEDQYVRFFDANSGQCTYSMLAHPASISSLSLSPDGRELVSAGHDASLRFWSLEKRSCTQEITSHRIMRGEGACSVVWSQDGKFVVSAGGDGVAKVFSRL